MWQVESGKGDSINLFAHLAEQIQKAFKLSFFEYPQKSEKEDDKKQKYADQRSFIVSAK